MSRSSIKRKLKSDRKNDLYTDLQLAILYVRLNWIYVEEEKDNWHALSESLLRVDDMAIADKEVFEKAKAVIARAKQESKTDDHDMVSRKLCD
eukprot:scaffold322824_cov51-Attheya_sp.AAC.2